MDICLEPLVCSKFDTPWLLLHTVRSHDVLVYLVFIKCIPTQLISTVIHSICYCHFYVSFEEGFSEEITSPLCVLSLLLKTVVIGYPGSNRIRVMAFGIFMTLAKLIVRTHVESIGGSDCTYLLKQPYFYKTC